MFDQMTMAGGPVPAGAARVEPAPSVVERARRERCAAYAAEARLLVLAAEFADEHPVPAGALHGDGYGRTTHWVDGMERVMSLAGEGTPEVAEFAPAELGAALGVSTEQARALVGEALELRHRLPRCWARVLEGAAVAGAAEPMSGADLRRLVPVWLARQVAAATMSLPAEGAAFVDDHVAEFLHRLSRGRVLRLVEDARARFDPAEAEHRAEAAADTRRVQITLDDPALVGTGLASVWAITDTDDAASLDVTLDAVAGQLAGFGHEGSRDVRRAAALGVLASPQWALDLLSAEPGSGPAPQPTSAERREVVLYLHLSQTAVSGAATSGVIGAADGLGPITEATVRSWLGKPDVRLRVTPVIDLNDERATDGYAVPAAIAERVALRDSSCRFPWCDKPARPTLTRRRGADLDHVEPYVPPDEGGPPGQTSIANLAPLCRLHHRMKTHSPWSYRVLAPGVFVWRSPEGRRYRVTPQGTEPAD